MKFRRKPEVVEARRWTGRNTTKLLHWMCPNLPTDATAITETIRTLEGEFGAAPGDWIIKGVKGEFYPCKPDIFAATYEKVEEEQP